ncbi:heat shock protein 16-48a [Aphelenchoides avenae]|nr:heat shock protein 16-48a [Aphelenchus avenae]
MSESPASTPTSPTTPTSPIRRKDSGGLQWRCTLETFKPEGLKVELEGDDVLIRGQQKNDGGYRSATRCLALPQGVSRKAIKCFIDEFGHVSIEAYYPSPTDRRRSCIPVEFRRHHGVDCKVRDY